MDSLQQTNLAEIEGLNQRGRRTLSFVDLIRAGTMSAEMVAYCWTAIANGASFLTAARPGGAGKSTVLANLLALLPPGEEVVTFGSASPVSGPGTPDTLVGLSRSPEPDKSVGRTNSHRRCTLAHEIGSGHWYGYIWGAQVREFLSLKAQGHRLAACLHADTLAEVEDALCSPPLSCSPEQMRALDLILFIHVLPEGRRVVAVHEATAEGYRQVFAWDPKRAEAVPTVAMADAAYEKRLAIVRRIVADGLEDLQSVRAAILAEYEKD